MAAETGAPLAGGNGAEIRAADADRDRVAGILGVAYTEGRLSKEEYDARLETAFSSRTYADLDRVISDLPAQPPAVRPAGPVGVSPVARTNGYAIASLACGLGQFVFGPLGTIPAIVFGHMAMSRIRRTGEQGAGLAIAGLALGWGAVIIGVIFAVIAIVAGMGAAMHGMGAARLP